MEQDLAAAAERHPRECADDRERGIFDRPEGSVTPIDEGIARWAAMPEPITPAPITAAWAITLITPLPGP